MTLQTFVPQWNSSNNLFSTKYFAILDPRNPPIEISELYKKPSRIDRFRGSANWEMFGISESSLCCSHWLLRARGARDVRPRDQEPRQQRGVRLARLYPALLLQPLARTGSQRLHLRDRCQSSGLLLQSPLQREGGNCWGRRWDREDNAYDGLLPRHLWRHWGRERKNLEKKYWTCFCDDREHRRIEKKTEAIRLVDDQSFFNAKILKHFLFPALPFRSFRASKSADLRLNYI